MKKSRIIVPALAMLTLSVAASVTGTVAWFTASRSASATLNSLVAIDTAGALNMELAKGNAEVSGNTVTLNPLRDFSYSVSTAKDNAGTGYIALFNSDGDTVTATRGISPYTDQYGEFSGTKVYYANTFSATFSTTEPVTSYLFFNNNHTKSHIGNGSNDYASSNSVYKALRVSMKATNSNDEGGSNIKIITWAPYTSLDVDKVYNIKEAATIANGGVSVDETDISGTYKTSAGEGTTSIVEKTQNVVKINDEDPITEGNTADYARRSNFLLSDQLIGGNGAVSVTVNFVIWFEGLDPNCLSGNNNISTITQQARETITMGFYAIQEKAFAAA